MSKLKPSWVKTDIPLETKIKLWRIMIGIQTYESWGQGVAKNSKQFNEIEDKFIRQSRPTYKALQDEIRLMPIEVIKTLPEDIREWIISIRPEVKERQNEQTSKRAEIESGMLDHFNELAGVARILAFRAQWILDIHETVWHDRPIQFSGTIDLGIKTADLSAIKFKDKLTPPADLILSKQLLFHFNMQFPELALEAWYKITREKEKEVTEKLTVLGYGKAFIVCPSCPVCKAIKNI